MPAHKARAILTTINGSMVGIVIDETIEESIPVIIPTSGPKTMHANKVPIVSRKIGSFSTPAIVPEI